MKSKVKARHRHYHHHAKPKSHFKLFMLGLSGILVIAGIAYNTFIFYNNNNTTHQNPITKGEDVVLLDE